MICFFIIFYLTKNVDKMKKNMTKFLLWNGQNMKQVEVVE